MKKAFALLLALLLAVSCFACTGAKEPEKTSDDAKAPVADTQDDPEAAAEVDKNGGTLVIATTGDASTINLYEMRGTGDVVFMEQIFESLMRLDETGKPQPFLAESVVGDPEALTYTIVLNKGIKFHDGSELTAEVCKWNLEMYKEYGVLSSSFMSKIDTIEVVDDYTVVIHMSAWDPFLPNNMARPNGCGYMASKKAYDENGLDWVKENPVTTAPFKLETWERDTQMKLVRFDDYWRGTPYLDGINIVVYATPLVAQAALEAGEVHVLYNATIEMANFLKESGYSVVSTKVPSNCYSLPFDCTDPNDPLSNLKVRQAVCHAIDSQAIIDAVFGEYAVLSTQYSWPGSEFYNDTVQYEYDVEKAKQLLAEAGYADGFETVIHAVQASPYTEVCQIVQEQLSQVGIKVAIDNTDSAGYLANINDWGTGMLIHPMGLANGPAAQLAANFVQGLQAGLGVTTLLHPDDINALIQEGLGQSGDELVETFKEVQGMVFGDYCMIKVIGCVSAVTVRSPKLIDSGFGEVSASTGYTLHLAYLEK